MPAIRKSLAEITLADLDQLVRDQWSEDEKPLRIVSLEHEPARNARHSVDAVFEVRLPVRSRSSNT